MFRFLKLIKITVLFYSSSYDKSEMVELLKSKSLNLNVRIMLETWKYFLQKINTFWQKQYLYSKQ